MHRAFALPRPKMPFVPMQPTRPAYGSLEQARRFIIEESSMMSNHDLTNVATRLAETSGRREIDGWMQNKLLVLVGDGHQLPTVCKHRTEDSVDICWACHVTCCAWYKRARVLRLRTSVRHAGDPEYARFLDEMREGAPCRERIREVLGPCMVTTGERMAQLLDGDDTTVLCTRRKYDQAWNMCILRRRFATFTVVDLQEDVPEDPRIRCKPQVAEFLTDNEEFHEIHAVAIGARVQLTVNVNLDKGYTNGVSGVVTALGPQTQWGPSTISVRMPDGADLVVKRSLSRTLYWDGAKYRKRAFPLKLAYAMTAHKCQGATIASHVLLDVRDVFCPGQMYVMLSRVTHRHYLNLLALPAPSDCHPVPQTRPNDPTVR